MESAKERFNELQDRLATLQQSVEELKGSGPSGSAVQALGLVAHLEKTTEELLVDLELCLKQPGHVPQKSRELGKKGLIDITTGGEGEGGEKADANLSESDESSEDEATESPDVARMFPDAPPVPKPPVPLLALSQKSFGKSVGQSKSGGEGLKVEGVGFLKESSVGNAEDLRPHTARPGAGEGASLALSVGSGAKTPAPPLSARDVNSHDVTTNLTRAFGATAVGGGEGVGAGGQTERRSSLLIMAEAGVEGRNYVEDARHFVDMDDERWRFPTQATPRLAHQVFNAQNVAIARRLFEGIKKDIEGSLSPSQKQTYGAIKSGDHGALVATSSGGENADDEADWEEMEKRMASLGALAKGMEETNETILQQYRSKRSGKREGSDGMSVSAVGDGRRDSGLVSGGVSPAGGAGAGAAGSDGGALPGFGLDENTQEEAEVEKSQDAQPEKPKENPLSSPAGTATATATGTGRGMEESMSPPLPPATADSAPSPEHTGTQEGKDGIPSSSSRSSALVPTAAVAVSNSPEETETRVLFGAALDQTRAGGVVEKKEETGGKSEWEDDDGSESSEDDEGDGKGAGLGEVTRGIRKSQTAAARAGSVEEAPAGADGNRQEVSGPPDVLTSQSSNKSARHALCTGYLINEDGSCTIM
uniref:Uncharacterized protein n=1 Tax=Chromera velia CCMP2878 TaxID=1169474 RepID=A0A0G4HBM1_9ALVE|eukprot:Cvel_6233.t1-p1 / transcript=Cvel_6233.t1 / gene=Cvel_6233 / organism=Chromera_velia_CCMP2878 / gene_product=hypothetical protein / transcript_product=hypothetical protein / location=Cvel_scaffold301:87094-91826(+) / protein_length=648 / sequence_SO=supercontig / SO=protein_coding / is_pseudo=false